MKATELLVGLATGAVLVVFGLVPGLLQTLAQVVAEAIQNFRDSILAGLPASTPRPARYGGIYRPTWLAGIGALVIVLFVVAYFSN